MHVRTKSTVQESKLPCFKGVFYIEYFGGEWYKHKQQVHRAGVAVKLVPQQEPFQTGSACLIPPQKHSRKRRDTPLVVCYSSRGKDYF